MGRRVRVGRVGRRAVAERGAGDARMMERDVGMFRRAEGRGRIFGADFVRCVESMGIRKVVTAPGLAVAESLL